MTRWAMSDEVFAASRQKQSSKNQSFERSFVVFRNSTSLFLIRSPTSVFWRCLISFTSVFMFVSVLYLVLILFSCKLSWDGADSIAILIDGADVAVRVNRLAEVLTEGNKDTIYCTPVCLRKFF